MKNKILFIFLLFIVFDCFSQDFQLIEEIVSFIGKPLPNGLRRAGINTFVNDSNNMAFIVDNNIIISSSVSRLFDNIGIANAWSSQYLEYFENNGWVYLSTITRGYYFENINLNLYALVGRAYRREDGIIIATIIIRRGNNLID